MTPNLLEEKTVSVNLEDGSFVNYTLRGLKQDEIGPWAAFCASVFAYKANPPAPAYFERHFYNDPSRDATLVRVLFSENEIVSSCRIFQRRISTGRMGATLTAGGIGEVCTANNHRRRGLSKILLQDAIRIMTLKGMQMSLLHAAPAFFPVYESRGFECIVTQWSVVSIDRTRFINKESQSSWKVRQAEFPLDTARLHRLHASFSEERFAGCIVRSKDCWNQYISKELEGSLWVVERAGEVIAWLSLRRRGDRYQLREFGCDASEIAIPDVLPVLLRQALRDEAETTISLHLPTLILNEMPREVESNANIILWETLTSDDDNGWMYKSLQDDQVSMSEIVGNQVHLIWPADSF